MIVLLPGGTHIDTGSDTTIVTADDGNITLHTPLALFRLIERWKGKPNLAAILTSYTDQLQLLENALWETIAMRMPDYADTAQLDVIGRLVGEPRNGQSNAQFRARVKVRTRINQSLGEPGDIIDVLQLLDPATFTYKEFGTAYFEITYTSLPVNPVIASQIPSIVSQTRAAGVGAMTIIPADITRGALYGSVLSVPLNQTIGFGTVLNTTTGGLYAHIARS